MAGGGDLGQMNVNDFFQQAWEYENQKTILDSVLKTLNTASESHPFAVVRLQELHTWAVSGEYAAILSGKYARRGDASASPSHDLKAGWEHYISDAKESNDPLVTTVRNAADSLGKATGGIRDALKDMLKK
jgi:hypothetical protein